MSMLFPWMDLTNEFRVPLAVDEAWAVLEKYAGKIS